MKHFKIEEFNCPCCGKNGMEPEFLGRIDEARSLSRVPFKINSGFRCEKHNLEVGGKPTSSHRFGYAGDISTPNSRIRFMVLEGLVRAGFTRIGIGSNFIHCDNDPLKPPEVLWLY